MIDYIKTLREYNEWRRGSEIDQPDPKRIGEAIDALIAEVERLRNISTCGCGDSFTEHDPGTCGNCLAGMVRK